MSIRNGADGAEVILLQGILYSLDYEITEVDGIFGQETEEAVIAFQDDNDLEADGIVGENTAHALSSALWMDDFEEEDEDFS